MKGAGWGWDRRGSAAAVASVLPGPELLVSLPEAVDSCPLVGLVVNWRQSSTHTRTALSFVSLMKRKDFGTLTIPVVMDTCFSLQMVRLTQMISNELCSSINTSTVLS